MSEPRPKKLFGLHIRTFKLHRRWAVDNLDYAKKLPAEAQEWLEKFNREFYDASFGAEPLHATVEQKRALYVAQNAAHRDVMSSGQVQLEEQEWLERRADSRSAVAVLRPSSSEPATPHESQMKFPF